MSFEIIPLKIGETNIFCRALYSLWSKGLGFPEEALNHYKTIWKEDTFKKAVEKSTHVLLSAWEDEKIVGLLVGTPQEGGVGTIIWVLVADKYQRKGIGQSLFLEACRIYRDMKSHKVKLTVPQKETIQFYEKQGMQVEGFHLNHWWNMNVWSMGKIL